MIALSSEHLPSAVSAFAPLWAAACAAICAVAGYRRLTRAPRRVVAVPSATRSRWRGGHRRRAVAVAGLGLAGLAVAPMPTLTAVAAVIAIRLHTPIRLARDRRRRIEHDLPAAMDLLVLSVRAGLMPHRALGELAPALSGPVGEAFVEVTRRTERGHAFADALGALPELLGPRAGGIADVIATGERHGLPIGPTLDQLALEARAVRQRLDQAEARKLPVRLAFPLVACTLPSFVLLAIVPAVISAMTSLGASSW